MAPLKCTTKDTVLFVVQMAVMSIAFTVFVTLVGAYKAFASSINCNPLNPNVTSPIINTNCIANNNDTQVLVQITNCNGIKDAGYLIPYDNKTNFKTLQTCWYSSGDVNCSTLTSNSVILSNMTVSYKLPLEMKMWFNYQDCLNEKARLNYSADSYWAGAGPAAGILLLYSGIYLLYYGKCQCKKKEKESTDDLRRNVDDP